MRQYSNEWWSFVDQRFFSTFGNEAPVYIAWGRVSYVGVIAGRERLSQRCAMWRRGYAQTLVFAKSVLALPLRSRVQEWRSGSQGGGRMQSSCSACLLQLYCCLI